MKNNICINVFYYEDTLTYPIHISEQKFENSMDLLLISYQYMYIKDFDRFMFCKTKRKNIFAKVVYSVLRIKLYWQNIKMFV